MFGDDTIGKWTTADLQSFLSNVMSLDRSLLPPSLGFKDSFISNSLQLQPGAKVLFANGDPGANALYGTDSHGNPSPITLAANKLIITDANGGLTTFAPTARSLLWFDGSSALGVVTPGANALVSTDGSGNVTALTPGKNRMIVTDNSGVPGTLSTPARGGIDLRRALYDVSATSQIILAQNYELAHANINFASSTGTGVTRYHAVYWPGGTCTGMYYMVNVAGSYTDTNVFSGTALYSTNGTTLTRVATLNSKLTEPLGLQRRVWTTPASNLAEGIYYVGMRLVFTAGTAALWAAMGGADPTTFGGDTQAAGTPSNWPLVFAQTDNTQALPSTVTISGLTQGALNLGWVGLY